MTILCRVPVHRQDQDISAEILTIGKIRRLVRYDQPEYRMLCFS